MSEICSFLQNKLHLKAGLCCFFTLSEEREWGIYNQPQSYLINRVTQFVQEHCIRKQYTLARACARFKA